MSARIRPGRLARLVPGLLVAAFGLSGAGPVGAEPAASHHVRITRQRPDCSPPPGMPVVPTDPGAFATPAGRPCYGRRPPELSLDLPEGRYVWLQENPRSPGAWVSLGPGDGNPAAAEPRALGIRLSVTDNAWTLETRRGRSAVLTPLQPGHWAEIEAPGGAGFWIMVEDPGQPMIRGRGR